MNFKLIIFDLDGVLVDACEWHRVALNAALKEVCDYEISLEDHYEIFNGIPTKVKLQTLTDMGIVSKKQHQKVYDLKQTKTVETINKLAKIRDEKIVLLETLKDKGYSLACYTNSIRLTANLMLEKTGIYHLFDKVLTNQDVKKSKPDPEGYELLMSHFGASKKQTLIVEDSPKGILAAQASGAKLMKVENPDCVDLDSFRGIIL